MPGPPVTGTNAGVVLPPSDDARELLSFDEPAAMREVAELKRRIGDLVDPHDPAPTIAYLAASSLIDFPLAWASVEHDVVEYVVAALLERPPGRGGDSAAAAADLQEALRIGEQVRNVTRNARLRADLTAATALVRLAAGAEFDDAFHRYPGYLSQGRKLIESCFASDGVVANALQDKLGFDGRQALAMERAFTAEFARRYVRFLTAVFLALGDPGPGDHVGAYMQACLGGADVLSVAQTAPELAEAAAVPPKAAAAFLDAVSIAPGTLRGGLPLITGRNEVRRRPLVEVEPGSYLPTVLGNLLWALRPMLEGALRADSSLWNTYQSARAAYVERATAELLCGALDSDDVFTNVAFRLGDDDTAWEADVVAHLDDVLLVIEVKSGELSARARQGRKRELRQDLRALLGKAARQADRLVAALQDGDAVRLFERATGAPLDVGFAAADCVYPVIVTLEDLTVLTANPSLLRAADIIPSGVGAPWVVNIFDLEMIVAACEYPALLTRYIAERAELDPRVWFNDEAELWLAYLAHGLDFSRVVEPSVLLSGRKMFLNQQWAHGGRAPTMPLRRSEHRRLRALHRDRPPGWLADAEDIIAAVQARERLGHLPRIDGRGQR